MGIVLTAEWSEEISDRWAGYATYHDTYLPELRRWCVLLYLRMLLVSLTAVAAMLLKPYATLRRAIQP